MTLHPPCYTDSEGRGHSIKILTLDSNSSLPETTCKILPQLWKFVFLPPKIGFHGTVWWCRNFPLWTLLLWFQLILKHPRLNHSYHIAKFNLSLHLKPCTLLVAYSNTMYHLFWCQQMWYPPAWHTLYL